MRFFSIRSERKVPRDHNNSFVPVRNTGFQSLEDVGIMWVVWQDAGWEGDWGFRLGSTATQAGAGSEAGNS